MKAVVLEIKDGYAAVLSEDGQFRKIKDDGYFSGMELTLESIKEKKSFGKVINFSNKRLWQSAASVAAALLILVGVKDFYTPYGTISLDVNPSIEISINRYDRVLVIEAVNEDAEEIVDELNACGLKYKSVDDAVDKALSSFSEGDYAAEDGTTYVMMSANSKSEKHSDKIVDELDNLCKDHGDISAQAIAADDGLMERAKEFGTTAGKLYLVENLRDVSGGESFDEADWLQKPVRDIIHEIDSKEHEDPSQDAPTEPAQIPDENTADEPQVVPPQNDTEKPQSEPPQGSTEKPQSAPTEGEGAPDADASDKPQEQDEHNKAASQSTPPEKPAGEDERQPTPEQVNPQEQNQAPRDDSINPPMDVEPPEDFAPSDRGNDVEPPN